jgi:hypothetical protein
MCRFDQRSSLSGAATLHDSQASSSSLKPAQQHSAARKLSKSGPELFVFVAAGISALFVLNKSRRGK